MADEIALQVEDYSPAVKDFILGIVNTSALERVKRRHDYYTNFYLRWGILLLFVLLNGSNDDVREMLTLCERYIQIGIKTDKPYKPNNHLDEIMRAVYACKIGVDGVHHKREEE